MIAHYYDCSHIEHVCTYILCTFDLKIFLGLLNLDIITSTTPLKCLHCLFVCNLQFKPISFLHIQTLHNDCSPIEDVHRGRRSRAEFGLVCKSTYLGFSRTQRVKAIEIMFVLLF